MKFAVLHMLSFIIRLVTQTISYQLRISLLIHR